MLACWLRVMEGFAAALSQEAKLLGGHSLRRWQGVMEGVPASRGYAGGFAAELMVKDLGLALRAARASGAQAPLAEQALQLYQRVVDEGRALDFSAVYQVNHITPDLGQRRIKCGLCHANVFSGVCWRQMKKEPKPTLELLLVEIVVSVAVTDIRRCFSLRLHPCRWCTRVPTARRNLRRLGT